MASRSETSIFRRQRLSNSSQRLIERLRAARVKASFPFSSFAQPSIFPHPDKYDFRKGRLQGFVLMGIGASFFIVPTARPLSGTPGKKSRSATQSRTGGQSFKQPKKLILCPVLSCFH